MKQLQGVGFIALALFLLWIGVTGRFDALIKAIGIVRTTPPSPKPSDAVSPGNIPGFGSVAYDYGSTPLFGLSPSVIEAMNIGTQANATLNQRLQ